MIIKLTRVLHYHLPEWTDITSPGAPPRPVHSRLLDSNHRRPSIGSGHQSVLSLSRQRLRPLALRGHYHDLYHLISDTVIRARPVSQALLLLPSSFVQCNMPTSDCNNLHERSNTKGFAEKVL